MEFFLPRTTRNPLEGIAVFLLRVLCLDIFVASVVVPCLGPALNSNELPFNVPYTHLTSQPYWKLAVLLTVYPD